MVDVWNRQTFQYIAAHELAAGLERQKARALPMFHTLTGCDTVSSFAGHSKKSAWAIWNVLPEFAQNMSCSPLIGSFSAMYMTEPAHAHTDIDKA